MLWTETGCPGSLPGLAEGYGQGDREDAEVKVRIRLTMRTNPWIGLSGSYSRAGVLAPSLAVASEAVGIDQSKMAAPFGRESMEIGRETY